MNSHALPPVLSYADPPTATSPVSTDVRRITVLPVVGWNSLGRGLRGWTLVMAGAVAVYLVLWLRHAATISDVAAPLAEFSVVFLILFCICLFRLQRRLVFEVTPFALHKTTAGPFGVERAAWPRSAVREVHLNRFDQRLVLRLAGQDPLEIFLGPDPLANQRTADDLVHALAAIPPVPEAEQTLSPDPLDGLPPSTQRSVLTGIALCISVVAALSVFVFPPAGCYVFALAAIPAGLAYGSQRKDFYV